MSSPIWATDCVLPAADGGRENSSSPSIIGRIQAMRGHSVVIRTAQGVSYTVGIEPSTELFTAYGGGFEFSELASGQYASIWLEGCSLPKKSGNVAAVLQLCSLSPEACRK